MSKASEKPSDMVSFRLAAEFLKTLGDEAAREDESPNVCARRLLVRALTNTGQEELRHEFEELRAEQRKLREDFATLANVLLVRVAKEDPKKAEAWIREHLAP